MLRRQSIPHLVAGPAIASSFLIPCLNATTPVLGSSSTPASPPNIILIVTDDQGYGDLGCYPGKVPIETPNIDRLAHEGVLMTDAYAAAPICGPSRAAIMTGIYQQRIGFYGNFQAQIGLPEGTPILPGYLRESGYTNGLVGKWHLGHHEFNHPLVMGFDTFFGFLGGQHDYYEPDWGSSWYWGPFDVSYIEHNGVRVDAVDYLTDEFSQRALDFLRESKDQPFFLYLAYNTPHAPLQANVADLDGYVDRTDIPIGRANLRAMLDSLDRGVGQILDFLDDHDLADNTFIVYYGDNGGLHETENTGFDNWILNGSKGMLSEGGIRVPALARWPGVIPAGSVYNEPIHHIDILPTILAAAGMEVPGEVEGANLLPHWRGEADGPPHETLNWANGHESPGQWAIRKGDWKLVRSTNIEGLYNLADDISETTDLSDVHPDIREELWNLHLEWREDNVPSLVTRENSVVGKGELIFFRRESRGPSTDTRNILRDMRGE